MRTKFAHLCIAIQVHSSSGLQKWLTANAYLRGRLPRGTPALLHKLAHANGNLSPTRTDNQTAMWTVGAAAEVPTRALATGFWEHLYKQIPDLQGGLWGAFHAADQAAPFYETEGVVAACDGSYTEAEEGPNRAGSGATFRAKDDMDDLLEKITCDVSSLIPEIHAAIMVLRAVPRDVKLTNLTDSATLPDLDRRHPEPAPVLEGLLQAPSAAGHPRLHSSTGRARGPHHNWQGGLPQALQGCCMNEVADRLADPLTRQHGSTPTRSRRHTSPTTTTTSSSDTTRRRATQRRRRSSRRQSR